MHGPLGPPDQLEKHRWIFKKDSPPSPPLVAKNHENYKNFFTKKWMTLMRSSVKDIFLKIFTCVEKSISDQCIHRRLPRLPVFEAFSYFRSRNITSDWSDAATNCNILSPNKPGKRFVIVMEILVVASVIGVNWVYGCTAHVARKDIMWGVDH